MVFFIYFEWEISEFILKILQIWALFETFTDLFWNSKEICHRTFYVFFQELNLHLLSIEKVAVKIYNKWFKVRHMSGFKRVSMSYHWFNDTFSTLQIFRSTSQMSVTVIWILLWLGIGYDWVHMKISQTLAFCQIRAQLVTLIR